MKVKKVGVVGMSGVMGSGVAQLCAQAGYEVIGFVRTKEKAQKTLTRIEYYLNKAVESGKFSLEKKLEAIKRIKPTKDYSQFADCEMVIECAIEDLELKKRIFNKLDKICSPQTILATNTSSLSIIDMAMVTERPHIVLGIHFFNPAPIMKLLEVVKTIATNDETVETACTFGESLGKTVVVTRDSPGYIVNTLLIPYLLNAIRMLDRGLATREDIDTAIKLGLNYPMGPLTLSDFIGLDALLYVSNVMYEESKEPQFAAPTLLKKMVTAGWLGRKTGKGFYEYNSQ
jgi:3-hydroxybutyryl-CoA dehydrogenase